MGTDRATDTKILMATARRIWNHIDVNNDDELTYQEIDEVRAVSRCVALCRRPLVISDGSSHSSLSTSTETKS